MAADSDSRIAWHRAQVKKHRDALKRVETSKFTIGKSANPKAVTQNRKLVAELTQKIRLSEQVIAEHEDKAGARLQPTSKASPTWPGVIGTPMADSAECTRRGAFVQASKRTPGGLMPRQAETSGDRARPPPDRLKHIDRSETSAIPQDSSAIYGPVRIALRHAVR
jgi:hypothetical protein